MMRGFLSATPRCLCASLAKALKNAEHVWNLNFSDDPTTNEMIFYDKSEHSVPLYHLMDLDGNVVDAANEPAFSKEEALKIHATMVRQRTIDRIMMEAQRQGRISFYMTCFGEEGSVVGAAAALDKKDEAYLQYREAALLLHRGYTIPEIVSQCMGNIEDVLKGRQMPIHYGSRALNVHMLSSPLGTQIPHASGAGYALRLENETQTDPANKRVAVAFFGEGAASEGDFHAGLNIASTTGAHTLFFTRNNAFAISTPTSSQYKGDGIVSRGVGYGIPSVRVDGHDVLAVLSTVRKAREMILSTNRPVLVEAMTYRVSHHSTSDDSTAYRTTEDIRRFEEFFSPITRYEKYLAQKNWWTQEVTQAIEKSTKEELLREIRRQEKLPHWPVSCMHDDVYKEKTPELQQAQRELDEHYERNKETYSAGRH